MSIQSTNRRRRMNTPYCSPSMFLPSLFSVRVSSCLAPLSPFSFVLLPAFVNVSIAGGGAAHPWLTSIGPHQQRTSVEIARGGRSEIGRQHPHGLLPPRWLHGGGHRPIRCREDIAEIDSSLRASFFRPRFARAWSKFSANFVRTRWWANISNVATLRGWAGVSSRWRLDPGGSLSKRRIGLRSLFCCHIFVLSILSICVSD